ncbi:homoserine dehydrogenase [Shouchella shacheensis]|uniref:homoserine dehydrogenase n=1 Tax=Shouchella shacheensis TaxID=1649580 RepID=UPI0007404725|nr:homoserine dehydrogenase [Shouchella shacheensis]
MEQPVRVGLLGLGTVGTGVVSIITRHQHELSHQVGRPVEITKVLVRDLERNRGANLPKDLLTEHAEEVVTSEDVDVVIEVMGGIEYTKGLMEQALKNKKHVVTANKDLMAEHGADLLALAAREGCDLYYEASVAGGIPILRSLTEGLSADRITKMMGIVNGTTNYILTKMSGEGRAYEDVLQEAKQLGFAEADPTADVEGLDAARKMAILATLGFSAPVQLEDVTVKGISAVTKTDLYYSNQLGYTMKLIGIAKRDEGRLEVSVEPTLLPKEHPLASVQNEYNAVYVYGEAVGETMFYGPGAGSLPTATAVVSDLVSVMKNMRFRVNGHSGTKPLYEADLKAEKEKQSQFFIRLYVADQTGTFKTITSLFADYDVSFEKLLQLPVEGEELAEIIIITHQTNREAYGELLERLASLEVVRNVASCYRVEGGN